MIGAVFLQRGWLHEAALAFDTVAERWPSAEKAPEAVYRALQVYSRLNSVEKKPALKKKVDERMKTLASAYSSSPFAASAQLVEGQELEESQDFVAAAELYARVQPGTPSYLEAQYRLGNAYWLQARKLLRENKAADSKQYVDQADTILKKAIADLDREAGKTLDLATQARLSGLSFAARTSLAQMYLLRGVDRPADVMTLLADVDERFATDPDKVALAWGFRIDALQAQGKFEDAVKLLDGLAKKNPDSPALGTAAGKVARALDARAQEVLEKEKNKSAADDLLRRAAQYYSMSGKSLLKGEIRASAEVASIADRLFVLGLIFNDVPEGQGVTFVGWDPKKAREPKLWQEAADLYAAALRVAPSYKTEIALGRCHGFLGDWSEARTVLAALFDREPVWDGTARRFQANALRSKPELLYAYLEWGVAEHLASAPDGEIEGLTRAASVLENLVGPGGLTATSPLWWHAKYHQCKALADAGRYTDAELRLRDTERQTSKLGGDDARLQERFKSLKAELAQKTLTPQAPGSAPAPNAKAAGGAGEEPEGGR
jgi:tetratricopeptide (TPR) repeat protein